MKLLIVTDRVQAYVLRDLLQMQGIRAHVLNANMQGAVGELPIDAALPQVWIENDRDLERARAVVAQHEADRQRTGERVCPECGERNPATFDLCWKCGRGL